MRRAHPWLRTYSDRSITELEFLHGALQQPPKEVAALFCLRDPGATATVPESLRQGAYADTDPEAIRRLADLKQRVRASGYPVLDGYGCSWDPAQERLGGLEGGRLFRVMLRTLTASFAMGVAAWLTERGMETLLPGRGLFVHLVQVSASIGIALAVLIGTARLVGLRELTDVIGLVVGKLRRTVTG